MHSAFDVGMHNKRLSLALLSPKPPLREEPRLYIKEVREAREIPPAAAPPLRRPGRAAVLGVAAYALVVAGDYVRAGFAPPSHGSTVAVLVATGGPWLLLGQHLSRAPTALLAATAAALFVVTSEFVWDAQRFVRAELSAATLCSLAAVLLVHAAGARPADMSCGQHAMCAGAYAGALAVLVLLQGVRALDAATLLALQQLFVVMTLLLAGLVRSPAHC